MQIVPINALAMHLLQIKALLSDADITANACLNLHNMQTLDDKDAKKVYAELEQGLPVLLAFLEQIHSLKVAKCKQENETNKHLN